MLHENIPIGLLIQKQMIKILLVESYNLFNLLYMCVCVYICLYIHIYIHLQRKQQGCCNGNSDIDWWCFVFCFLFSVLIGCCRSHGQMPTSHCFAWQWASVAVSMTHRNYRRKAFHCSDFSVHSYHCSHITSSRARKVACFM